MGYYLTGDYYRGDYYGGRRMAGGGLLSAIGGLVRTGLGLTPGVGGLVGLLPAERRAQQGGQRVGPFQLPRGIHLPGLGPHPVEAPVMRHGKPHRGVLGPDGKYHTRRLNPKTGTYYRYMNPGNPRALRRAVRREHAFVGLVKRVLRGTGITISRHRFATKARGRKR